MSDNDFTRQFEITSPCTENWDVMIGNDRVRFCSHCQLSVHDLSQLNRKQIRRLILKSKGRLCVRYSTVNPRPTPVRVLHKIGRRTSIIAASAFSATLGLSSAMAASSVPANKFRSTCVRNSTPASRLKPIVDGGTAAVYGVIFDPAGAVIPSATITIINVENNVVVMTYTDGTGQYRLSGLEPGMYNLKIEAAGFAPSDVPRITLRANDNNRLDQTLSIAQIQENVDVKLEKEITLMGGAMIALPSNPLIKAAIDDNIEELKEALISIDANVRDPHTDSTALEHAVRNGNREMVQLLLWAKADVNARDRSGQTALMMLDGDVTTDMVWDLLNAGAKVNLRDTDGDTALSEIATVNNTEVLKTLLDAGAKVNAVNNQGQSALMKAAAEGLVNNIRVLVQAGADINQQDKGGKTALIYAKEGEHRAAIRLLISLGAIELPEKEKEK
ncbi:MAG TPA: ankyrin repeat domain-containing protein [Pyrinomonadaceae bacterium]